MTFPNCLFLIPNFVLSLSIVSMVNVYLGVFFSSGFLYVVLSGAVVLSWWFSSGLFSYPGFVLPWVMPYRRSDCFAVLLWEMAGMRLVVSLCV